MRFRNTLFSIFILSIFSLEGGELYLQNIRPITQEIFKQHIEYKDVTPLIMKRAIRLYVARFDPHQQYLTSDEIRPFLIRSDEEWAMAAQRFRSEDYSDFKALQEKIEFSIQKARNQRKESSKEKEEWVLNYFIKKGNFAPTDEDNQKASAFYERIKLRREEMYTSLNEKEFAEHVLKAVVASLDAHSAYYTAEEASDIRASLKKQFYGVGIMVGEDADGYFITDIVPRGPAATTGLLHVGDQILTIDGKALDSLSLRSVMRMLQGGEGVPLSLKVKNAEGKIQTVHLAREKILMDDERIKAEAIPFSKGNIGYIQVDSFYDNREGITVERDLREAICRLSGTEPLYGIVLDMRNNLGGFLDQAIKVAGLFIQQGVVVIAKYAGDEIQYSRDYDPYAVFQGPVVVLTSKTSASAAEIVAGTLQDYGAAVVVGDERTYGKGSMQMQTITDEFAPYFYKVTVGKYYTISGRSTQIEGVKAQIHVPTQYAPYTIGEKFLQFPLQHDSLVDVQGAKGKLKQFFSLYQQKKSSPWNKMVPLLNKNSQLRISNNADYQAFIDVVTNHPELYEPSQKNRELSKRESIQIAQDMALLTIH